MLFLCSFNLDSIDRLKKDIEKWNKILQNYTGFEINKVGSRGTLNWSLNLFDWQYQRRFLKQLDIDYFKNISLYCRFEVLDLDDSETISKCMSNKKKKKEQPNLRFENDDKDKLPNNQVDIEQSRYRIMFQYKVIN